MSTKKMLVLFGVLFVSAILFTACAGPAGEPGPAGPEGPAGPAGPALTVADLSCAECHDEGGLVSAKKAAWELNKHGNGTAMLEEYGRAACAFCHSGNAFSAGIAAGQNFTQLEAAPSEPARQDCRACHQIHKTYTSEDWALETTDPVAMVIAGTTYDGGTGNLCVNCHQARRYMANFVSKDKDGNVIPDKYTPTIRFNTHLSDQSDIMMGTLDINTVLGVEGKPGAHYSMVENTCVGCHLGEAAVHTFEPQLATCVTCHSDAENTNVNDFETKFEEKFTELHNALVAKGLLTEEGVAVTKNADGSPVQLDPPQAAALFLYGALEEDASKGAHNPKYVDALLEAALAVLK
ncbi:MAG TPA: collagen-like protein [Anaerolineales bacterium]|nr:collagen-like protein [Anaerolineales bacterium]